MELKQTIFTKYISVDGLDQGVINLQKLSWSIEDSLGGAKTVQQALSAMAYNTLYPPTGNGVGWSTAPQLKADAYGAEYCTSGGLIYGWCAVFSNDYARFPCTDFDYHVGYKLIVAYPNGFADTGSTLAKSAKDLGWDRLDLVDFSTSVGGSWGWLPYRLDSCEGRVAK